MSFSVYLILLGFLLAVPYHGVKGQQGPKPGMCPSTDGMVGTCVEECMNDMDCMGEQKCCSNGCGHTCVDPMGSCPGQRFRCVDDQTCIPKSYRCDAYSDCEDNSDEVSCSECAAGLFLCANAMCIPSHWFCDYENDCGDYSDESAELCGYTTEKPTTTASAVDICAEVEFTCAEDQSCIPEEWKCDGINDDCADNSDEVNCLECANNGLYLCTHGKCIPRAWVCDGEEDCVDGDDEAAGMCTTTTTESTTRLPEYCDLSNISQFELEEQQVNDAQANWEALQELIKNDGKYNPESDEWLKDPIYNNFTLVAFTQEQQDHINETLSPSGLDGVFHSSDAPRPWENHNNTKDRICPGSFNEPTLVTVIGSNNTAQLVAYNNKIQWVFIEKCDDTTCSCNCPGRSQCTCAEVQYAVQAYVVVFDISDPANSYFAWKDVEVTTCNALCD